MRWSWEFLLQMCIRDRAFYKRKTGAAFSKEMARSVRAMLKAYAGKQEEER